MFHSRRFYADLSSNLVGQHGPRKLSFSAAKGMSMEFSSMEFFQRQLTKI